MKTALNKKKLYSVLAVFSLVLVGTVIPVSALALDGVQSPAEDNRVGALNWLKKVNEFRAQTHKALTPQEVADADRADNGSSAPVEQYDADAFNGQPRQALKVNEELMQWAQTRANELASQGGGISHDNTYNGAPSWAYFTYDDYKLPSLMRSPNYKSNTFAFGPENLASQSGNADYNPVQAWGDELNADGSNPMLRHGYGHYLALVSPLANMAGFGVAQSSNGKWVYVFVSAYSADQPSKTVEEALADSSAPAEPTPESVDPVTAPETTQGQAPQLPAQVTVRYSDGTTAEKDVTWNKVTYTDDSGEHESTYADFDWSNAKPASYTVTGDVQDTQLKAAATVTVTAKPEPVEPESAEPSVSATDASGKVVVKRGESLNISLSNFTANATVNISLHSTPIPLGSTVVGTDGSVAYTVTIPDTAEYGDHNIVAEEVGSSKTASFPLTVQEEPVTPPAPATVVGVDPVSEVETASGVAPVLPETVRVRWSNGDVTDEPVAWSDVPEDSYKVRAGGQFEVTGRVVAYNKPVSVTVRVAPATVEDIASVEVKTTATVKPSLPENVTVQWSNGDVTDEPVVWEEIQESAYAQAGTFQVAGSVTLNGQVRQISALVTVEPKPAEPTEEPKDKEEPKTDPKDDSNVTPKEDSKTEPSGEPKDDSKGDGVNAGGSAVAGGSESVSSDGAKKVSLVKKSEVSLPDTGVNTTLVMVVSLMLVVGLVLVRVSGRKIS